jgi:hypothetical protein
VPPIRACALGCVLAAVLAPGADALATGVTLHVPSTVPARYPAPYRLTRSRADRAPLRVLLAARPPRAGCAARPGAGTTRRARAAFAAGSRTTVATLRLPAGAWTLCAYTRPGQGQPWRLSRRGRVVVVRKQATGGKPGGLGAGSPGNLVTREELLWIVVVLAVVGVAGALAQRR